MFNTVLTENDDLTVQYCSDKTDRDLMQQAPSARLILPPFEIILDMLHEINEENRRNSV